MHVTQLEADVTPGAKDVRPECGLVHEIHRVCTGGNIVVGEHRAPSEFEIRREPPAALEVPLQSERIEAYSVRRVGGLEDQEDRNGVHRIFEAPSQKARKMQVGEDPPIAQSRVERTRIAAAAADGVPATRPYLNLMPALLRAGLGEAVA